MHRSIRHSHRFVMTLAMALWLGAGVCGQAQDAAENPGLRGILPDFVPEGLSEDDFLTLGDSWAGWSKAVAAEVAKFYEDFELDVAGQRASIETLQRKIGVMETALGDFNYTAIHLPLATMHARLKPRIDLAEAILDTLEDRTGDTTADVNSEAQQRIAKTVDELESYLAVVPGGDVWMDYLKADRLRESPEGKLPLALVNDVHARLTSPDFVRSPDQRRFLKRPGFVQLRQELDRYLDRQQRVVFRTVSEGDETEALREALWELVDALELYSQMPASESAVRARRAMEQVTELSPDNGRRIHDTITEHFLSDNLRIVVSETFLSRVAGHSFDESGDVDDFILGAVVKGKQRTTGKLFVDLQPGENQIQFYMRLDGVVRSNTVGTTDEAVVTTSGHHSFAATKSISFNGDVFRTTPAEMSVNANNTTTGARVRANLLLLDPIANQIALNEARRRKGRSEAIAADRVRQRVLPEFNTGIEEEFAKLTSTLETKVNPRLLDADLFPSRRQFTSTEDELHVRMRLMDTFEFGGNAAPLVTSSSDAAVIHIHESLLNNALSRVALASLELTEAELMATLVDSLGGVLGDDFAIAPSAEDGDRKPDNTKFVFPAKDVLRVRIDDGLLTLVLRAGLKPEKGDEIPTQEISIPLSFSIADDKLQIEAEAPSVSPVEPPSSPFVQIARAGVVKAKMQAALPTRTVDAAFTLDRKTGGPVALNIAKMTANAGWLSIVIQ